VKPLSCVIALFLLAAAGSAVACKCPQDSLAEEFSNATVVFVGSTAADPSQPGKSGETIPFQVSRSLKGAPPAGATLAIDPFFETDCTAPFVPGAQLLVFAYGREKGAPVANACSVRAAEPISIGGRSHEPSPEVIKFLRSVPN
jgi:hypothetical protein